MFSRTIQAIGETAFARLQSARVILFGVGGVGGWCAEALVRTGVQHLTIVDFDTIAPSNLNRQVVATAANIGQTKVEQMRLRLIIPLMRTVTPDEYAAVARRVADDLNLTRFDPTTFEPARLMYWPSTPENGEFVFQYSDAPFLDPDEVLNTYADWRDASLWPTTQPVEERIRHTAGKQEDPTEKLLSLNKEYYFPIRK